MCIYIYIYVYIYIYIYIYICMYMYIVIIIVIIIIVIMIIFEVRYPTDSEILRRFTDGVGTPDPSHRNLVSCRFPYDLVNLVFF